MTTLPSASAPVPFSSFSYQNLPLRVEQDTDGEPLFHANDLCAILEYSNPRDAIARHVHEEDVVKRDILTQGGAQQANFIREPGMWSLIFGSHAPAAKPVKRWVTSEVLPSIRKTGRYEATAAHPSIQSHFQGGRWLVHVDSRGNLIFNPVDCEAFHVPASEFPAVISSAEFPSRLLPMVLVAAAERMAGAFDRRQRHPVGPSTATQPIPWAQAARYVGDPWHGPIEEWLIGRSLVTSHQILSDCLRIELARQTRSDQIRVGNIMVQLKDWTKKNVYFPETGKQRWAYVRVR